MQLPLLQLVTEMIFNPNSSHNKVEEPTMLHGSKQTFPSLQTCVKQP